MISDKYRHTFHLHGGEVIVAYSESDELPHATFGNETAFFASGEEGQYTIPLFSIGYIETQKIEK